MKRFLVFLFALSSLHAQTPFSSDSALSYLKTIAITIGARPIGSPNEHRAMEFALTKFREIGLTDVYLMDMTTAENDINHTPFNTNSGIAVGILHGKTNRIIVIGGHMDSAGPDIPGANDDGSGSAVVIELARVLAKEQHQSTIVFCLFGGEEAGLCGSEYFVRHFPQLDNVDLMLQIDMANGSIPLMPIIDSKIGDTPQWLVQAAYEEFGKLNYSGLFYPTHFFTAMSMLPGGGVGSDHEPFLEKNIPAIDFTSDVNDPIHTPQDDFEHFNPTGLKRSGDLVYALAHRFDSGVPASKAEHYYLVQFDGHLFFLPLWLVTTFIIFAVILSIGVLLIVRKRRTEPDRLHRPVVPALKLFLLASLIQTCVWLSENVVGLMKGVRFPWIANPEGYFILGFLASLIGIGLSVALGLRLHLSRDPYRWFLRTIVFLVLFIFFMSLSNAKAAFYPSTALFLLTLAMFVRKPWLKFIFWIASPYWMFRLIFSEGFFFIGRDMALHATQPLWMYIILHVFYILFFALWSFPFLLSFAAIYFDSDIDLLWLKQWRTRKWLIVLSSAFALCAIMLSFYPSYSDTWRSNIVVDQSIDLNTGKGRVTLRSNEYLKHLFVHLPEKDTSISTWDREILLKEFTLNQQPWIRIERSLITSGDSGTTFDLLVRLHFRYRPRAFTLSYSKRKSTFEDISTSYNFDTSGNKISLRWESFPDTVMSIPIRFKVSNADSITEDIQAKFVELVEPVRVEKVLTNIIPRTTMERKEILHAY